MRNRTNVKEATATIFKNLNMNVQSLTSQVARLLELDQEPAYIIDSINSHLRNRTQSLPRIEGRRDLSVLMTELDRTAEVEPEFVMRR